MYLIYIRRGWSLQPLDFEHDIEAINIVVAIA